MEAILNWLHLNGCGVVWGGSCKWYVPCHFLWKSYCMDHAQRGGSIYSCNLQTGTMWFLPSVFSSVYSLSYVVAVAEIFSTVLSKNAEYGYPCFSEDFRGNTLNFLSFIMMFLISLPYTAFMSWGILFLQLVNLEFYQKAILNYLKWLFCIYGDDLLISVQVTFMLYRLFNLHMLIQSSILEWNSVWYRIFLKCS